VHLQVCSLSRTARAASTAASTPEESFEEFLWIDFLAAAAGFKVEGAVSTAAEAGKTFESCKGIASSWPASATESGIWINSCVTVCIIE